jgi:cysteine desulfurase
VDRQGCIDPAELRQALVREETTLVTLALCNHELGNLYPIVELCRLSHQHGALFHCDAVQAVGRIPVDVGALDIDLLSLSAHKLFGPKGTGALYVRAPAPGNPPVLSTLPSLLRGGAQEKGRRAGTENVSGISGLGAAATLARSRQLCSSAEVGALRDRLEERLLGQPGARRHGDGSTGGRCPGTSNLAFAGVEGELLFMNLDLRGIAISTGAACSSGSPEPSAVLLALGLQRKQALEAVRFSLGPENTLQEVEQVLDAVIESLALIRSSTK